MEDDVVETRGYVCVRMPVGVFSRRSVAIMPLRCLVVYSTMDTHSLAAHGLLVKWYLPLCTNHFVGLPLCLKAFLENTSPHQQHWATVYSGCMCGHEYAQVWC